VGIEPTTSNLRGWHSATELPVHTWCARSDSNGHCAAFETAASYHWATRAFGTPGRDRTGNPQIRNLMCIHYTSGVFGAPCRSRTRSAGLEGQRLAAKWGSLALPERFERPLLRFAGGGADPQPGASGAPERNRTPTLRVRSAAPVHRAAGANGATDGI
jgi:hypothetical protein